MRNPLSRLKSLPWKSLSLASTLAVLLLAFPIDRLFRVAVQAKDSSPAIARLLVLLATTPLGLILTVAIPVGVGALAVSLLERLDRRSIDTGSLWGLVLCVQLVLLLQALLLYGAVGLNQFELVGVMLGVFCKSRPYWR